MLGLHSTTLRRESDHLSSHHTDSEGANDGHKSLSTSSPVDNGTHICAILQPIRSLGEVLLPSLTIQKCSKPDTADNFDDTAVKEYPFVPPIRSLHRLFANANNDGKWRSESGANTCGTFCPRGKLR